MSDWIALLYGFIQGISEFAPVSSSGHLALLPHLIGFTDPGLAFDLAMHVGTAFAVMVYFSSDLKKLIGSGLKFIFKKVKDDQFYFLVNFIISTIATVFLVLIFKDIAEVSARKPELIAFNLIFFGVLMWWVDRKFLSDENISMKNYSLKKAIFIGLAQGIAVFPGVSRSGITLTAARFFNLSRSESARYSFLLSLPIILAGAVYKAPKILAAGQSFEFISLIIGIVSSFVFGLITIHFFLKILKKFGLGGFAIYRILIALFVLWSRS